MLGWHVHIHVLYVEELPLHYKLIEGYRRPSSACSGTSSLENPVQKQSHFAKPFVTASFDHSGFFISRTQIVAVCSSTIAVGVCL